MVIYDLDGSETDSAAELPKSPMTIKATASSLQEPNRLVHNRRIIADTHEVRSYVSSSAEQAVDLSVYGDNEAPRKRPRSTLVEPERVNWSDDGSSNDGEAVYKKFKARKSEARKLAIKSGKKARAAEVGNAPPSSRKQDGTGVGKQAKRSGKVSKTREKTYGDASSEDDLMEWTLPDYLKERRARFDERMEHLKQGGLRLPPTYDDLDFSDDEQLEHLKERPDFPLLKACAHYADIPLPYSLGLIPAPIAQWLRDYQVKGVEFLHELFVYQKGGILADDMGLGKTVQVIAFLAAAYGKTGDERDRKRMRKSRNDSSERWYPRTLIICPGTLMSNWQDELHRWGWWYVDVYHGSTASKDAAISAALSGRIEILITTYTTYRNCKDAINMVAWDCVVADECHILKERRSETTQAMNEVNALCRIGLTGTAIQNKYEELWTLLNWTNPGRFGPVSTWKASISEPLKLGQSHDATVYQLSRARKTAKKLVENLLPQFFLRRMKTLIKDQLPKKSDRVVFCPLTDTQASAYEKYLDSEIVQMIKNSSDPCHCGSGKKAGWCCHTTLEDGTKWQTWVFPAISTLQKLSNHLAILIPQGIDPPDKQAKDLENLQVALPDQWENLYRNRDSILNYANPEFCGKWRILKKLLKFWHDEGGNKVLVFSHSVRLLKMLQMLFTSTAYTVAYLDGAMKYDDRYKVVTDFNADPTQFVFLISTKAGGVGLNITSANKVVVVDPNWNPSYDLQAQDRAYRIGQTRDVEVFRLISQGTLEEIVYARQIYKQQQASIGYNASNERRYFQGVQDRKDQKGEIFGLTNLFAYQGESVVLKDIVNKLNISESRAGVRLTSLELDDDSVDDKFEDEDGQGIHHSSRPEPDDEDAAISQLAAEIIGDIGSTKGRKKTKALSSSSSTAVKKHDPIQAILSAAGVQYTHENSEVIGSSKVEAQLSKRAEEAADGAETHKGETRVFFEDPQSQTEANEVASVTGCGGLRYRYRPPDEVKRRTFCTMAKWAGYDDPVTFALVVEGWTQANRRDFLTDFYQWRRDVLSREVSGEDSSDPKIGDEERWGNEVKVEDDDEDDEL
jgi:DNA excision repair protein ERCC-6-like 2